MIKNDWRSLSRSLAFLAVLGGLISAPGLARDQPAAAAKQEKVMVYVGTYTKGESKGIYRFHLDLATGALTPSGEPAETANPSFVAFHPGGRFLYAVNETGDSPADKSGAVSAFAIDPGTGALTFLNQQPSGGPAPCYLVVDKEGRHVLVANYFGGSVSVLRVQADGRLGAATAFVAHKGSSVDPERQEGPHAHYVNLDAANRFAFVADLGLDKVLVYRFDPAKGTLAPNDPPAAQLAPGAGPRHLAFHPGGHHAYVLNELNATVTAFAYDPGRGVLTELQTLPTLPTGFTGRNLTAEVVVSSDGKFLYASNRGHDSIAIFGIDAGTGKLTPVGHQSTLGKTPRNFAIDPTGTYLLAANQNSDTIAVFKIDRASGRLAPVGTPVRVPKPVCIRMRKVS